MVEGRGDYPFIRTRKRGSSMPKITPLAHSRARVEGQGLLQLPNMAGFT